MRLPHFADRDPLSRLVLEQILAGVSTRRFERTGEPVGSEVEAVANALRKAIGPLASLVAPYDVIRPDERLDYVGGSPYNVVHTRRAYRTPRPDDAR